MRGHLRVLGQVRDSDIYALLPESGRARFIERLPLNNLGQVVGRSDSLNYSGAFLYSSSNGIQELGTLGGQNNVASAINDAGQIVGAATAPGLGFRATLWNGNSSPLDLGTLGGSQSFANGINKYGIVVGASSISGDSTYLATKWSGTTAINLSGPGVARSEAMGINSSGLIVGHSDYRAILWTDTGAVALDGNGGAFGYATSINDAGQIVGQSVTHATLWDNGQVFDLGVLPGFSGSVATGINQSGLIVGYSNGSGTTRATIWESNIAKDLNSLIVPIAGNAPTLLFAQGINDSGQIAAIGIVNGQSRAFLLSPIPELSTCFLLIAGLGLLTLLLRRPAGRLASN